MHRECGTEVVAEGGLREERMGAEGRVVLAARVGAHEHAQRHFMRRQIVQRARIQRFELRLAPDEGHWLRRVNE